MCKCKWFIVTQDLHVVYMAIDTYMHNTSFYQCCANISLTHIYSPNMSKIYLL